MRICHEMISRRAREADNETEELRFLMRCEKTRVFYLRPDFRQHQKLWIHNTKCGCKVSRVIYLAGERNRTLSSTEVSRQHHTLDSTKTDAELRQGFDALGKIVSTATEMTE